LTEDQARALLFEDYGTNGASFFEHQAEQYRKWVKEDGEDIARMREWARRYKGNGGIYIPLMQCIEVSKEVMRHNMEEAARCQRLAQEYMGTR
jgi:hypothetical protein